MILSQGQARQLGYIFQEKDHRWYRRSIDPAQRTPEDFEGDGWPSLIHALRALTDCFFVRGAYEGD